MQDILDFLAELAYNNNSDWFHAHRQQYDACRKTFEAFVSEYLKGLTKIEPLMATIEPKHCIWRINRDIRFSADKRPYKEWFGAFPAVPQHGKGPASGGKKSDRGGYYIHIQPGQCMFAGGIWGPSPELLNALRREIEANYEELEDIMAKPAWKRYFGDFDTYGMLKKVPQGFDKDFVHADWLKRRCYTFTHYLTDEEVCAPDFLDKALTIAKAAKPMNDFLNYTFEEYGEFPQRS